VRRAVLGEKHVNRSLEKSDSFTKNSGSGHAACLGEL